MAGGDNQNCFSHVENAVLPWAVTTLAVLVAIAFGITAGIQSLELDTHHLVIPTDPKGPNWAEIANAVLTLGLVVAALRALRSISEAKRARIALQMNELSRRWDDEPNREVRRKVHDYAENGLPRRLFRTPRRFGTVGTTAQRGPDRLRECMVKLQEVNDPEYRELLTEPNLVEDLAVLVTSGGIDFEIVDLSLGPTIAHRWAIWKPTVDWLRELRNDPRTFREFEKLAKQIAASNPNAVEVNAAGDVVCTEFR
jgi:hypothetical protein